MPRETSQQFRWDKVIKQATSELRRICCHLGFITGTLTISYPLGNDHIAPQKGTFEDDDVPCNPKVGYVNPFVEGSIFSKF